MHNLLNLTVNYLLQYISTQVKPSLWSSLPHSWLFSDWLKQHFGYRPCQAVFCQLFSSVYRIKFSPLHSGFSVYRWWCVYICGSSCSISELSRIWSAEFYQEVHSSLYILYSCMHFLSHPFLSSVFVLFFFSNSTFGCLNFSDLCCLVVCRKSCPIYVCELFFLGKSEEISKTF